MTLCTLWLQHLDTYFSFTCTSSLCQRMYKKRRKLILQWCNATMSDTMLAPFECAVHGQQTHNKQGGRETTCIMYHTR